MTYLDPRSLIILVSLLALICVLILFALRRSFPRSIKGLGTWAWGTLIMVLCAVLFALRGKIPDLFSVVLANGTLLGGALLLALALRRFGGMPVPAYWKLAAPPFLLMVVLAGLVYVRPDYHARLLIVTFVLTGIFCHLAWLALHCGQRSFAAWLTGGAFGINAMVSALRLGSAATGLDAPQGLFDPTLLQATYLAAFNFTVLVATVGFILMANERLRDSLEYLASHDALSGALSRRAFLEMAEGELARSLRHDRPLSLLMLDLDHFKSINDRYGHLVGDRVIKDFSRRAHDILRRQDMLGRYGGEEFAVLLPETRLDEARNAAERIRAGLAGGDDLPPYSVSIGAALAYPGMSLETLLSRADQALYRAKANGRNRVEVAEDAAPTPAESASAAH